MKPWYRSQTQLLILAALACLVIAAAFPAVRSEAGALLGVLLTWLATAGRVRARRRNAPPRQIYPPKPGLNLLLLACLLSLAAACTGCMDQGGRDPFYLGVRQGWDLAGPEYRDYIANDPTLTANDRQGRLLTADWMDELIRRQGRQPYSTTRPATQPAGGR